MTVGYVPYSPDLTQPGDRRRFVFYARRRGVEFEIATPDGDFDVVVVTPRADLARWAAYPRTGKLVFDIVDSYLDIPRADLKQVLRGPARFVAGQARTPFFSFRRALERMLERADAVTCATPEQARVIAPYCRNVHPILDAHSEVAARVKDDYSAGTPFKLVWEGLGENVRWFETIRRPLADVAREHPIELHLVTERHFKQAMQRFWTRDNAKLVGRVIERAEFHPWTVDTLAEIAPACDLAVIPLPLDRGFERGKPESKLVGFWRMGVPVVTSATPAYVRVMDAAGQHWHCRDDDDWRAALTRLIVDQDAREEAGRGGHAFAEREYSDERLLAKWDRMFESLPARAPGASTSGLP